MKYLLWGIGCGVGFFGICLIVGSSAAGDFELGFNHEDY